MKSFLVGCLMFVALAIVGPSLHAQTPVPTVGPTVIAYFTVPCSVYAGTHEIPAGYTLGDAQFAFYEDWTYKYVGGCMKPTNRLSGNMVVDLTNVRFLDRGAMSGSGADRVTYNIRIPVGQVYDGGSEYYNVTITSGATQDSNASVSFDPAQGAGEVYFYLPFPTPEGKDQSFRQIVCKFFSTAVNEKVWSGFLSGTDYKDGGRTAVSISNGQCSAKPQ